MKEKQPELATCEGVIFRQDKARPHTSLVTRKTLLVLCCCVCWSGFMGTGLAGWAIERLTCGYSIISIKQIRKIIALMKRRLIICVVARFAP